MLGTLLLAVALGQPNDLPAEVLRQIRALDADTAAERDQAEAKLEQLGPDVLPHLPRTDNKAISGEQRARLTRLIPKLWSAKIQATLSAPIIERPTDARPLSDWFSLLEKATGNKITDRRRPADNPVVKLAGPPKGFWETLDALATQNSIGYYFATEDRSVGVVTKTGERPPVSYAGALRFSLLRVSLDRDFEAGSPPILSARIEVVYEPRIRPLVLEIDASRTRVEDDRKQQLTVVGPTSITIPVDNGALAATFPVRVQAPTRDARALAILQGEVRVGMMARVESFVFDQLAIEKPARQSNLGVGVELTPPKNEEGVWSFPVYFDFPSSQLGDSHLEAAHAVEAFLEKPDGSRFPLNGDRISLHDGKRPGTEFLFVDAPGKISEYKFHIQIPTGITRVSVPFHFRDVRLP